MARPVGVAEAPGSIIYRNVPEIVAVLHQQAPQPFSTLHVFTHIIRHEFHHKGQMLNMSRQLGCTPVDTDAIRR
ncbi:hypothetical protein EI291_14730 [Hymenobacter rigui]|uniref:Damage-inducible protein DinB n=1 Tax=Hymenobacter rigui TaxID=334424 RepID=A0A3R9MQE7_9BACT|nr:hypothetical protein EI291_14730 [Hymenobacter rigui]